MRVFRPFHHSSGPPPCAWRLAGWARRLAPTVQSQAHVPAWPAVGRRRSGTESCGNSRTSVLGWQPRPLSWREVWTGRGLSPFTSLLACWCAPLLLLTLCCVHHTTLLHLNLAPDHIACAVNRSLSVRHPIPSACRLHITVVTTSPSALDSRRLASPVRHFCTGRSYFDFDDDTTPISAAGQYTRFGVRAICRVCNNNARIDPWAHPPLSLCDRARPTFPETRVSAAFHIPPSRLRGQPTPHLRTPPSAVQTTTSTAARRRERHLAASTTPDPIDIRTHLTSQPSPPSRPA